MEVDSIDGVKLDKKGGFKYMILSDIITRDVRLTLWCIAIASGLTC